MEKAAKSTFLPPCLVFAQIAYVFRQVLRGTHGEGPPPALSSLEEHLPDALPGGVGSWAPHC